MELDNKIIKSKEIINDIFKKYRTEQLSISFNGGKDNIVMFYLIMLVIREKDYNMPILFNITNGDEFNELKTFISKFIRENKLNYIQYNGNIKDGIYKLKNDYPEIKIIFMGTRYNDFKNNHNIGYYHQTDDDWPEFIRVYPVINFSYSDVWKYISNYHLPYCNLYDKGYTSLGDKSKTIKNKKLKYIKDGITEYNPAYLLDDESFERLGRLK